MFGKLKSLFKKDPLTPSLDEGSLGIGAVPNAISGVGKTFKLKPEEIAPINLGLGGCLATDRIVVDGCVVGYMYRERPINTQDSGWRFFSGDESPEYMAENRNHDVYDVNTIINYDPAILPFLDAVIGSKYERDDSDFILVE